MKGRLSIKLRKGSMKRRFSKRIVKIPVRVDCRALCVPDARGNHLLIFPVDPNIDNLYLERFGLDLTAREHLVV